MAPLDQVDHFINTVYTDPRFRPPRPESTPVAPGGPSTTQARSGTGKRGGAGKLNKPRGRVGAGFTRTESTKTVDGRKLLGYMSYHALSRAQRCHEGSRWRPSLGSLAQPTTLVPRDRRPIVMRCTSGQQIGPTRPRPSNYSTGARMGAPPKPAAGGSVVTQRTTHCP